MTGKQALEGLIDAYISWRAYQTRECIENDYRYQKVLKDLDRLEELEKENQELKEANKYLLNMSVDLHNEKEELKKAFDKACERLDWSCPTEQDLVDDFDCENCKDDYKECWKKYFLNEVLKE